MMTSTPNPAPRFEPIDDWQKREGFSTGTIVRAERHGIHLPVWIPDLDRVLVDTDHLYEWRQLVGMMDRIFEPDTRRRRGAETGA
jgi:hypothetical protein